MMIRDETREKYAQTVRVLATSRGVDPEGQRTAAFASEGRSANTRRNHGARRERRRAALPSACRFPLACPPKTFPEVPSSPSRDAQLAADAAPEPKPSPSRAFAGSA